MKQKLQELRARLQTKKGSILVYTLIIMMIMLATALSIFAVAVREKKGAGLTAASMQAFAVADSGSEIALNKIANVSTLNEVGSCASGIVTGSIGTGMDYTLTFYDSDGNQLLNCTDSVSAVDKVKSVGRYAGTARAVEVAVAASDDNNGNHCDWLELGPEKSSATLAGAIINCRNETTGGSDWYLPTAEELACFIGASGVSSSNLWTRTPNYGSSGSYDWVIIRLTDGGWGSGNYSSSFAFRCVR